jgi:hypothetical protein
MAEQAKGSSLMEDGGDLQRMFIYNNLSLLGILNHHSSTNQYVLMVMHRLILIMLGMGLLKDS